MTQFADARAGWHMTHQCPKCELRFTWVTELDDHCRTDHPAFHHDYPASVRHDEPSPVVRVNGQKVHARTEAEYSEILSTYWNER